jgi:GMP synthase (glutamine-hydrolysing)
MVARGLFSPDITLGSWGAYTEVMAAMSQSVRFLLLQARDADDPMRAQEVRCFARALKCRPAQIATYDLLSGVPTRAQLDQADIVLLGGSGDYSVAEGGPWLPRALAAMQELYDWSKPTFASCWGFQALAKALGGEVVTDLSRAELGTHTVHLTPAGERDPLFAPLGKTFRAHMGHQDIVEQLPPNAVRLGSTAAVENQAFTFPGKPIYCTQFHPELNRAAVCQRVQAYPQYIERIAHTSLPAFLASCEDTPQAEALLPRFVEHVLA